MDIVLGAPRSIKLMLAASTTSTLVYMSPDVPRERSNLPPLKDLSRIGAEPFSLQEYKRKTGCTVSGGCVHRQLLAIATMAFYSLNGTHLLRVVGLEQLEAETGGVEGSATTHVDYLTRCRCVEHSTCCGLQKVKNAVADRSSDTFVSDTVGRFARSHVGHEAMPRALRRKIHREWEKDLLRSWRNGEQI
jgi:hypothetical protein